MYVFRQVLYKKYHSDRSIYKELISRQILNTARKRKAEKDFHNKPKKNYYGRNM